MDEAFQFQYGAIKSQKTMNQVLSKHQFQFQYGAIKRMGFMQGHKNSQNFNSNMVRLKAVNRCDGLYLKIQFQFQYGAIKSKYFATETCNWNSFQFQYGAIKRRQAE